MKNIIKDKRVEFEMTTLALSKLLGISEDIVISWESGSSEPSIPEIIKISQLFNIQIDDLVAELAKQKTEKHKLNTNKESDKESDKEFIIESNIEPLVKSKRETIKERKQLFFRSFIALLIFFITIGFISYISNHFKYNALVTVFENSDYEEKSPYQVYLGFKELGNFKDAENFTIIMEGALNLLVDLVYETYEKDFPSYNEISDAQKAIYATRDYHDFSEIIINDLINAGNWAGVWSKDKSYFSSSNPYNTLEIDIIHKKVKVLIQGVFYKEFNIQERDPNTYTVYDSNGYENFSISLDNNQLKFYFGSTYFGTYSRTYY